MLVVYNPIITPDAYVYRNCDRAIAYIFVILAEHTRDLRREEDGAAEGVAVQNTLCLICVAVLVVGRFAP